MAIHVQLRISDIRITGIRPHHRDMVPGAIGAADTINISEKTAGFSIRGTTGAEGGVSVSVTIGTQPPLTATSTATDPATWSVRVPAAAAYISGTSVALMVSATKPGFSAPSPVSRTLTVDLAAPTAPSYRAPPALTVGVAITAMNPSGSADRDIAEYRATGLPPGLGIDGTSGVISGAPDTAANSTSVAITFPAVAKGAETTVDYTATPATVCTVSAGGALTIAGAGVCRVTATALANANYNEGTATVSVTVQATGTLAAPRAPNGLMDTAASQTRIDLRWTAPPAPTRAAVSGYKVEWSADGHNNWRVLTSTLGAATTSYADTGLSAGTTRHYRVTATSAAGDSSASTTVSATINTPPVAMNGILTTLMEIPGSVDLSPLAYDANGDGLTYTVTQPDYGSLRLSGKLATYTSVARFNGEDSFTYTVDDGSGVAATGTVAVVVNAEPVKATAAEIFRFFMKRFGGTVQSGNPPPLAVDDTAQTNENELVNINVLANDTVVGSSTLSVQSVTIPAGGSTTINSDNTISYMPNPGFHGVDTFSYTVSDGFVTATATVTVEVTAINAPVDDAVQTNENEPVDVQVE